MDIKKFAVESTGRLHLRDAADELMYDDNGQPIAVVVFGPGSKQYARAQAAQQNRLLDKLKKKGKADTTAEQKTAETAEFLADCTKAFENLDYEGLSGYELAKALYADVSLGFIADQVAKFLGDWANFTTSSPKS